MHGFVGIASFGRPLDTIASEGRMCAALTRTVPGHLQTMRADGVMIVVRHTAAARLPAQAAPAYAMRHDTGLVVADARIDNPADLATALGLAPSLRMSGGELLARAYARDGYHGLATAVGGFAFAHWDSARSRLTLARDCLGQRALFFHRGDHFIVFATSLPTLLALPCVPRTLDELALADFLVIEKSDTRQTLYRGVERVPTRTVIAFDRESTTHRIFWAPDVDKRLGFARRDEAVEQARALFDQAVAAAIADTPDVAISLSGGYDSSAIAATVARLGTAASINGYALVAPPDYNARISPAKYIDERPKLEALVAMHPTIRLAMSAPETSHPDVVPDRLFAHLGVPTYGVCNSGFYAHIESAAACAGAKTMLIGSAGNFGLTWSGQLMLAEYAHRGQWGKVVTGLWTNEARHGPAALLRSFVREAVLAVSSQATRDAIYRMVGRRKQQLGDYSAIDPAWIADHDLARRWQERGYDSEFRMRATNAAQFRADRLFDFNQAGRDYLCGYGEMHGFEFRDPHADRRLLEFALAVPEAIYHQGGRRGFARAVFADRLPPQILLETRRGEQGVGWFRHLQARRDGLAEEIDRIATSPLAGAMIDIRRLRALVDDWPCDEQAAVDRRQEYRLMLMRGVHVGQFIRWVEGGNG